jgi:ribosomal protein S18 acetylase RimI-like enzyme
MELNMKIIEAEYDDLPAILELQYIAFQSQARLLDNYEIPPLKQTLSGIREDYEKGKVLKAVDGGGTIIGSIRGYAENGTTYVNKVIVHPDEQGKGVGTKLLLEIEKTLPSGRFELFTSVKSASNLALYEKLGYVRFKEAEAAPGLLMAFMQKIMPE